MASKIAPRQRRINRDTKSLCDDPPSVVAGFRLSDDTGTLDMLLRGAHNTVYAGGAYVVRLLLPERWPFEAPAVEMLTPSGRFETRKRLCMSGITHHHSDQYSCLQTFSSIAVGIVSIMENDLGGLGAVLEGDEERRRLAGSSARHNKEQGLLSGMVLVGACSCDDGVDARPTKRARTAVVVEP